MPACTANTIYQKPPITKPFSLHLAHARTEIYFRIVEESDYAYILQFNYKNKEDSRAVLNLMMHSERGKPDTDGEPIYVSLEVFKIDKDGEYLQTQYGVQSLPLYSSGATFNKLIYRESLLPGLYRVVVTSNKDMPVFNNIKVDFSVSLAHRPK
ncbi:MAG: hypothetical protein HOP21_10730 [Methylotenera sp.]|nr:hypothetical protein [Methylotenera sp.]